MSFYSQRHYAAKTPEENFQDRLIYLEHLGGNRPGPQLDIGCSIGNFLALDPARIEGIDIDEDALAACAARGLRCRRLDIVAEDLPWTDHFEVVYLRHVIEHMTDPLKVMRKIRGILKPGGLLVVETPDYLTAHHRKQSNFWDDYTHKTPFTFRGLERLCFDAGFESVHQGRKPHYGYWTKKLLRSGRLSHAAAYRWHEKLNWVRDDLLFVVKRPA
jgi:SAM-dependent methyltransferase